MKIQQNWSKRSGIYGILNINTGKYYVGSSVNIQMRLQVHRSYLRANKHQNQHLQNSWNKHGEAAFICMVLEFTSKLLEREQHFIDTLPSSYNITKEVVRIKRSKKSIRKQSITRKALFNSGQLTANCSRVISMYDYDGFLIKSYGSLKKAAVGEKMSRGRIRYHVNNPGHVFESRMVTFAWGTAKKIKSFWLQFPHYKLEINEGNFRVAHLHHLVSHYGLSSTRIQYLRFLLTAKRTTHKNTRIKIGLLKPGELLETPEVDNQQRS